MLNTSFFTLFTFLAQLTSHTCFTLTPHTPQGSSNEVREEAAEGLGELVVLTSDEALKPFVTGITGALIKIVGDRFPAQVSVFLPQICPLSTSAWLAARSSSCLLLCGTPLAQSHHCNRSYARCGMLQDCNTHIYNHHR